MDSQTLAILESEFAATRDRKAVVATVATGALVGVVFSQAPASAQTAGSGVTEVSSTVAALGGIASACVAIAVVAFGARLAFKLANRVMTKG